MKKRKQNYFVREDLVSEQYEELTERKKENSKIILTGTILDNATKKPEKKKDDQRSEYFLG